MSESWELCLGSPPDTKNHFTVDVNRKNQTFPRLLEVTLKFYFLGSITNSGSTSLSIVSSSLWSHKVLQSLEFSRVSSSPEFRVLFEAIKRAGYKCTKKNNLYQFSELGGEGKKVGGIFTKCDERDEIIT